MNAAINMLVCEAWGDVQGDSRGGDNQEEKKSDK